MQKEIRPRRRHLPEFKARAVELAQSGRPIVALAAELGIGSDLIYNWLRRASAHLSCAQGTERSLAESFAESDKKRAVTELRALKRRIVRLELEKEILEKGKDITGLKPAQVREIILNLHHTTGASLMVICQTLGAPRSSFYNAATPSLMQTRDQVLGEHIEQIFRNHKGRYGYRRVAQELAAQRVSCTAAQAKRLMRRRGLSGEQ